MGQLLHLDNKKHRLQLHNLNRHLPPTVDRPRAPKQGRLQPRVLKHGRLQHRAHNQDRLKPRVLNQDRLQHKVPKHGKLQPRVLNLGRLKLRALNQDRLQPRALNQDRLQPRALNQDRLQPKAHNQDRLQPRALNKGKPQPKVLKQDKLQHKDHIKNKRPPQLRFQDKDQLQRLSKARHRALRPSRQIFRQEDRPPLSIKHQLPLPNLDRRNLRARPNPKALRQSKRNLKASTEVLIGQQQFITRRLKINLTKIQRPLGMRKFLMRHHTSTITNKCMKATILMIISLILITSSLLYTIVCRTIMTILILVVMKTMATGRVSSMKCRSLISMVLWIGNTISRLIQSRIMSQFIMVNWATTQS